MDSIVVHYSEIALKKGNRPAFERRLISNIKQALGKYTVRREYGRIIIDLHGKFSGKEIIATLKRLPGIHSFAFAVSCSLDMKNIEKAFLKVSENMKTTFRVETKRSNKAFHLKSAEINSRLGKLLVKRGWKVDLDRPKITFYIEVGEKKAYIYTNPLPGPSGLPVGSSGVLIALLSGGIDSPVAACRMMVRGCRPVYVHFFNHTQVTGIVKDKVDQIVRVLQKFQQKTRLYLVDFGPIQSRIISLVPAKDRMIVYRRVMFMIANKISEREGAKGFVTGDSIGQVASQTLDNLEVIYRAATLPVYSPLIGSNKQDIIEEANAIGTYRLSVLPYSDCCSLFVAEHPETRAKLEDILKLERKLDLKRRVVEAVDGAEVKAV